MCSEGLPPVRRSYILVEGLPPLGAFADLGPRSTVPTTNREKRHRRFPILHAPSKRKGARRGGGLPSGERWPAAGAAIVLGQITSKNGAAQRAASIPQGLVPGRHDPEKLRTFRVGATFWNFLTSAPRPRAYALGIKGLAGLASSNGCQK